MTAFGFTGERITASLLALAGIAPAYAWNSLSVTTTDGKMAAVQINRHSLMLFSDNEMLVRYQHGELAIPLESVVSFDFSTIRHVMVGVEHVETEKREVLFRFDGQLLSFPDTAPGQVVVTDTGGCVNLVYTHPSEIDLSTLGKGVYIVNVDGNTYKLTMGRR